MGAKGEVFWSSHPNLVFNLIMKIKSRNLVHQIKDEEDTYLEGEEEGFHCKQEG